MKINRLILPEWHHVLNHWTYPIPMLLVGLLMFFWTAVFTNISDVYILVTILIMIIVIRLVLVIQLMTADLEVVEIDT